jgi:predicted transcriptional regulator
MGIRIKHVNLKIEPKGRFFERVRKDIQAIDRGHNPKKLKETLSFESVESFRKILTPKRIELLRAIRHKKPGSIYELAKILNRDLKNIRDDIELMEELGLVDLKNGRKIRDVVIPSVNYDELKIAIAI